MIDRVRRKNMRAAYYSFIHLCIVIRYAMVRVPRKMECLKTALLETFVGQIVKLMEKPGRGGVRQGRKLTCLLLILISSTTLWTSMSLDICSKFLADWILDLLTESLTHSLTRWLNGWLLTHSLNGLLTDVLVCSSVLACIYLYLRLVIHRMT